MEDQLISFEVAKLAKEKGFNELCRGYYLNTGFYSEENTRVTNLRIADDCYTAPTQSLLQKWLREKYKLLILVEIGVSNKSELVYIYSIFNIQNNHPNCSKGTDYNSGKDKYEDALEEGLKQALNIIYEHNKSSLEQNS